METLEHAYAAPDGAWRPKIPPGVYRCVRGSHRLHSGPAFDTFEVTGVAGHRGILFHVGNFNSDSEGCVLCGQKEAVDPNTGQTMITGSRVAFAAFMQRLEGEDEFTLTVVA